MSIWNSHSYEFKVRKARKTYMCENCKKIINKGQEYQDEQGVKFHYTECPKIKEGAKA